VWLRPFPFVCSVCEHLASRVCLGPKVFEPCIELGASHPLITCSGRSGLTVSLALIPHPDSATVKWQADLKLPIVPIMKVNKSFVLKEARCMPGSAFSLRQTSAVRIDHTLAKLNFTSVTEPDAFFWATCQFTAVALLDTFAVGFLLLTVLCCCCCCWASRRKARARSIRLIEHTQVNPGGISIQQVAGDRQVEIGPP
jgi:hypothetical protein